MNRMKPIGRFFLAFLDWIYDCLPAAIAISVVVALVWGFCWLIRVDTRDRTISQCKEFVFDASLRLTPPPAPIPLFQSCMFTNGYVWKDNDWKSK